MSVFANLIPGAREVRPPLAAGGIALLAVALALEPNWPNSQSATGLTASLIAVHDALGPVGRGVVFAFAAYLVGSIVQGFSSVIPWLTSFRRGGTGRPDWEPEEWSSLRRFASFQVEAAFKKLEEAYGKNSMELAEAGAFQGLPFFSLYEFWVRDEEQPQEETARGEVSRALARQINAEGYLTQRRLLGAEPEWFAEVDRFEAEAELREAIALPLLTLGTVCALRSSEVVAGAAILFGSVVFTLALLAQGRSRRRRARDTLVDAVVVGRVQPPSLEQFEADLQALLAMAPK
jgi:hypothetical protein